MEQLLLYLFKLKESTSTNYLLMKQSSERRHDHRMRKKKQQRKESLVRGKRVGGLPPRSFLSLNSEHLVGGPAVLMSWKSTEHVRTESQDFFFFFFSERMTHCQQDGKHSPSPAWGAAAVSPSAAAPLRGSACHGSEGPESYAAGILITERSQISLLSSVFLCSNAFPKVRPGIDLRVEPGSL